MLLPDRSLLAKYDQLQSWQIHQVDEVREGVDSKQTVAWPHAQVTVKTLGECFVACITLPQVSYKYVETRLWLEIDLTQLP